MPRCEYGNIVHSPGNGLTARIPARCFFCHDDYPTAFELSDVQPDPAVVNAFAVCARCAESRLPEIISDALALEMERNGTSRQVSKRIAAAIDDHYYQTQYAEGKTGFKPR